MVYLVGRFACFIPRDDMVVCAWMEFMDPYPFPCIGVLSHFDLFTFKPYPLPRAHKTSDLWLWCGFACAQHLDFDFIKAYFI